MQLSEKPKIICGIFIAFLKSALKFQHLDKKISLLPLVFLKLLTPKDVLT